MAAKQRMVKGAKKAKAELPDPNRHQARDDAGAGVLEKLPVYHGIHLKE